MIVGAGPGGLEAARVAGERGHDVILLEAMPWAGGQLNLAVRNPRRRDLQGIVDWRVNELKRLGVDVRYDTFADADLVSVAAPRRRDRRHRRSAATARARGRARTSS